jgi:hypothetical protein
MTTGIAWFEVVVQHADHMAAAWRTSGEPIWQARDRVQIADGDAVTYWVGLYRHRDSEGFVVLNRYDRAAVGESDGEVQGQVIVRIRDAAAKAEELADGYAARVAEARVTGMAWYVEMEDPTDPERAVIGGWRTDGEPIWSDKQRVHAAPDDTIAYSVRVYPVRAGVDAGDEWVVLFHFARWGSWHDDNVSDGIVCSTREAAIAEAEGLVADYHRRIEAAQEAFGDTLQMIEDRGIAEIERQHADDAANDVGGSARYKHDPRGGNWSTQGEPIWQSQDRFDVQPGDTIDYNVRVFPISPDSDDIAGGWVVLFRFERHGPVDGVVYDEAFALDFVEEAIESAKFIAAGKQYPLGAEPGLRAIVQAISDRTDAARREAA